MLRPALTDRRGRRRAGALVLRLLLVLCLGSLMAGVQPRGVGATVQAQTYTCFARVGSSLYSSTDASAIQNAVNGAPANSLIKVAGACTGVMNVAGQTQTVLLNKSLTLEGGYNANNWNAPPDPRAYPTTLNANGLGRVISVTTGVNVTISNLTITGGRTANGAAGADGVPGAAGTNSHRDGGPGDDGKPGSPGGDGAGIYNGGTLTLLNSTVHDNVTGAGGHGGAGGAGGAGAQPSDDTDNKGDDGGLGGRGGAGGAGGAGGRGAGIYNAGTLTIKNATIVANRTGDGGSGGNGASGGHGGKGYNNHSYQPGDGGNGGVGGTGGAGGAGGAGSGVYNALTLNVENSTIANNVTGVGNSGGAGSAGGAGGNGGSTTISHGGGDGGNGGNGGSGGAGGSGGSGAGIYDGAVATVRTTTVVGNSTGAGRAGNTTFGLGGAKGEGGDGGPCCDDGSDGIRGTDGRAGADGSRGLGGVAKASGQLAMASSIIAGNSLRNCSGTINADNSNLADDATCNTTNVPATAFATWLGPLANNGGPTDTMLPTLASPAIDAGGRDATSGETDQRGKLRAGNGRIDAGAVEVMQICLTKTGSPGTRYVGEDNAPVQYAADQLGAAGGTIKIAGACIGTRTHAGSQQLLYAEKNLVLQGGWDKSFATFNPALYPTTLDAALTGRVLYVAQNLTVTVDNLNLTRGASSDGGAVYLGAGTNVNLYASRVYSNAATGAGGGVHSIGSTLTLSRTQVYSNSATTTGGGIYMGSGALALLDASSVYANSAATLGGGGIEKVGGALTIMDAQVHDNVAATHGGGIQASSTITVTRGAIFQNTGKYGGGVHNAGKLTLDQSQVFGNRGTYNAGGVYATDLFLVKSSVYSNRADASHGGGIYGATTVSLTQSSILSNTAAGSGGGLIYGSNIVLVDSTVSANSANNYGGGMWQNGALTLTRVTFAGNRAPYGGGIHHEAGALTAIDSTLRDNVATTRSGGAINANGGTISFVNSSFAHNSAKNGGAAANLGAAVSFDATNVTFTGNAAPSGGAIYNAGHLVLTGSTLADNTATSNGAGVYNLGVFRVTASTFQNNSATGDGGALYNAGAFTLTQSAVVKNSAGGGGGGIRNADAGTITVVNSTIGDNNAGTGGGGLYNTGGVDARFVTIYQNESKAGGLSIHNQPVAGKQFALFAAVVARPSHDHNNVCSGAHLTDTGGFSRISDTSCGTPAWGNLLLRDLGIDAPPYYLPVAVADNLVLDVVPKLECEQQLGVDNLIDQRSRSRPLRFPEHSNVYCDAGAVEYGQELHYVCGAPLDPVNFPARCQYRTVASALAEAVTEDTVIISGIITESVTVTKSVTIRGPSLDELTPGTHMGFVQASRTAPGADCATTIGSVFTVAGGAQVEMRDLNLRNGCAVNGGGVNVAAGSQLHLSGVTIYNSRATNGGAIYNSGLLSITNSTVVSVATRTGGSGGGLYTAAGGQSWLTHVTLLPDASYALENHSATAVRAASSIIGGPGTLCSGSLANGGYNLVAGAGCDGLASAATGDPRLGALRDNGGPTLTRAIISPDSPAVLAGADACAVATDQRGKQRPLNRDGAAGGKCDIGATEFGPQTLTVCANCSPDGAALRFSDLAVALNRAMAGDTVAIGPGIYTGNFVVYRDLTLRHAGVDVSRLDAAQAIDVRAILQASSSPLLEQRQALTATQSGELAGRVLTVHAFAPWGDTIVPAADVTANIQDLTVRYGMDRAGGAILNRGQLHLERMTLTANAAVNEYAVKADGSLSVTVAAQGGAIYNAGALTIVRSTLSGNQSESAGGAIFSNSALANAQFESLEIIASTLVDNKAAPLPRTWTVRMTESGFQPITTTVLAGDEIRFDNYQGPPRQLTVQPGGVTCNVTTLAVPAMGAGLSAPLVCTGPGTVTVVDSVDTARRETFVLQRYTFTPTANTLYRQAGLTRLERTILLSDGDGDCDKNPAITTIEDGGYNLLDDSSCLGAGVGKVVAAARQYLGDLQDNNQIDFGRGWLSGYVETHALLPNSPAIDQIPVAVCAAGVVTHSLGLGASVSIGAGDIVAWQNSTPATVTLALDDGEAAVRLLAVPPGATSAPLQPLATTHYRAYDSAGGEIGAGAITVSPRLLPTDQRGLTLPLRGVRPTATDPATFNCDIGAYEFQPWVVGQPVPRPPAAVGSLPAWQPATGGDGSSYHAWNTATAQDFALRPGYDESDADNQLPEQITVVWDRDPDVALVQELPLVGLIVWPDAPQVHVAGVPVDLNHSGVTDDFLASSAAAFEGTRPADAEAGALLANGIFTRRLLDLPGASYSVLQFSQNSGNPTLKIAVVQSLDWQTPGIVDRKAPDAAGQPCVIGTELGYRFTTAAGATVHHADPEGKAGYILAGAAYDGVPTAAELSVAQNTVDGLLPPAHARDTRDGPIIPVLEATPSITRTLAGHDLEVAWYRTDARNVAWPVKSAGYLCNWPANPPQIVIASELGSEIGGQPLLDAAHFVNATIYHQTVAAQPGYSPNWEHALLAASNLGNSAPALYALRTDLRDRIGSTPAFESYALLKYQDPSQQNRIQMRVYQVVVTAPAQPIAPETLPFQVAGELPVNGRVTLPVEVVGARNLANLTVRIPYDPDSLTPVSCAVNEQKFVEAPAGLTVSSDQNMRPLRVVHLRADLAAGTEVQYQWNLGDGVVRYAGNQVSNVYPNAGSYTVIVTATNGFFAPAVQRIDVAVSDSASPVMIGPAPAQTGCRLEGNEIVLQLIARNKHGESGNLTLADITFQATDYAGPPHLAVHPTTLLGPDYSQLRFNMTAGNPVYAPIPMRKLLDVQPCAETEPYQPATAKPFWKDFRDMVWARAAGEMQVLYYYPLQRSFPLPGGAGADGQCVPWMEQLASGTLSNTQDVRVLPVTYNVAWPTLAPLLTVGETVYERSKNGISGVAEQAAVAKIYDDLAPGRWDNRAEKIVIGGVETVANLAQLIDPLSAVSEDVDIRIDGNPSLPAAIKTERLLYGGGMALVGTTDNEITLPFALRSRVLFDDATGKLIFRGYYDGVSPEYIKGDPLLLLNVMSQADRTRLQSLCPTDSVPPYYDDTDCGKYNYAVNALYWKSHNPRQVDLCRTDTGLIWENGSQASNHDLLMLQNRIADAQRSDRNFSFEEYNAACPAGASRDLQPDWDFLIAVQDADDNGLPEAYEGLGKGKALSAGNAAGTGYVTLVYNNDASLGGLPVSLQVLQVGCTLDDAGMESPYRGNLLVIKSDNLFDEKLTLRHTGDFGGRPENFTFDWYIAPVDDTAVSPTAAPPAYPWQAWTKVEPGMSAVDAEITIEGANPTTLADNWLIMRYKGSPACGNAYRYSAWAGDPSAKPSEVRAQLAEGWIKRVTNALNPFDARVDDFVSSPVNSTVDMVSQAGKRYEGPIPFTADPAVLNQVGLIEAYQTVLERAKSLSIDNGVDDQGANTALLDITTRIAELYMLLANDAYADAQDPTVAIGTDSSLGDRAPTLYAFMNQFRADDFGLLDEELALLRGRDETLGGVAAAPTYNRLTWNFTNGDGEVAYVQNYNVKDINLDGFVDEADAALLYPQGHGDAWGHFLTAMSEYYQLLRHPNYTWIPRAESVAVAGAPVVADYYDERRFAIAAAAKAEVGAEIVGLTYRKHYADQAAQARVDAYVDPSDQTRRAWGVDDWGRRAGQGAYLDWVVANAILPPTEMRFGDVRKIDRTTVLEIGQIAAEFADIQTRIDEVDNDLNPLGIVGDAVLFDLDPSQVAEGKTHFEQVYQRAVTHLDITADFFDYANQMKVALRTSQNNQRAFVQAMVDQDTALMNELIAIFGYPYDADIGVNGTYPAGYSGPDIVNYDYIERTELTDPEARCSEAQINEGACTEEVEVTINQYLPETCTKSIHEYACPEHTVVMAKTLTIGLDGDIGHYVPKSWPSTARRQALGEVQMAMWGAYDAKIGYERALTAYENHAEHIEEMLATIEDRAGYVTTVGSLTASTQAAILAAKSATIIVEGAVLAYQQAGKEIRSAAHNSEECLPVVNGIDNDLTSVARCAALFTGYAASGVLEKAEIGTKMVGYGVELGVLVTEYAAETAHFALESDYELRQMGRELEALLREESELRLAVYLALDNYSGAQEGYRQILERGFRKLHDLERLRKRWSGQITEQRYGDMAYRIFQIDALAKYRAQFELAQKYVYLTAAAYDYETNLLGSDAASGSRFLRQIVGERALGVLVRQDRHDGTVIPQPGIPGLADPLARMRDNFVVLKGQMGFNNPQHQSSPFSLRHELLRLRDESDAKWRQALMRYYTPNIYANEDVGRLAKQPYGATGPEPGFVIPFGATITPQMNFFGQPLGPGDGAYNSTQFATKIASVGVWFDGYDTNRLARMPYVYLLPAGSDVMRPRNTQGQLRFWSVVEQLLPLPYPITQADMQQPGWIPSIDGVQGQMYQIKPYASFQAFPYDESLAPDEITTDTRLIGRSVWNTRWVLVIPGSALMADPEQGLTRFVEDVDDIYINFETYSYAGTR
jgi:hypothetical protein